MDLSKLPGKSGEDRPSTPQPPPPPQPVDTAPQQSPYPPQQVMADPGTGGEAYFSLAIGLIVLLIYPRFLKWVSSKLFGTTFAPYMLNGQEVPYTSTHDFPSDLAITAFGASIVVEGLVLAFASKSKAMLMVAAVVVGLATAGNLAYLVMAFSSGLPLMSLIAVLYGGWATRVLLLRAQQATR